MKKKAIVALVCTLPLLGSCFFFDDPFEQSTNPGTGSGDTTTGENTYYGTPSYGANYSADNLTRENLGLGMGSRFLPSSGESKLLVIPVQTSDDSFTAKELQLIEKGFFGEKEETGWESVSSYYEKSSYGKLHFTGEVTSPVTLSKSKAELESLFNSYDKQGKTYTDNVLDAVLKEVAKDTSIDLTEYDTDNDGYLDGVWMVYSPSYSKTSNLYWAFTTWSMNETTIGDYKLKPCCYAWASVDFFTQMDYSSIGNMTNIADAHTFIHETGHMLGLDDYYSYDYDYSVTTKKGNADTPLGGVDMMDFNIGDHCAYSKYYLGWEKPTVITPEYLRANGNTLTLQSHTLHGDSFLIPASTYNGTCFDEYLLVEYYTPDGLNEQDSERAYENNLKCYTKNGVLVYHINATVGKLLATGNSIRWDGNAYDKLPPYSNLWGTSYTYATLYSNTASFSWDTSLDDSDCSFYRGRLLSLLPATGNKIQGNKTGFSKDTSLFTKGKAFGQNGLYSNFIFDDGTKPEYGFEVDSCNNTSCQITFGDFE